MRRFKRIVCAFLVCVILCSSVFCVEAETRASVISQGAFDFTVNGSSVTVTKFYASGGKEVVIPSSVQGYSVTAIGDKVFQGSDITKITIPEGVVSIGEWTFSACDELATVILPASLTTIGKAAFNDCFALKSISLPQGVRYLASTAFSNCKNLESVSVSEQNPYFSAQDNVIFSKDKSTLVIYLNMKNTEYTVPSSVKTVGERAFYGHGKLQKVQLPAGLVTVEKYAFAGCTALNTINIPESLKKQNVGLNAFDSSSIRNVRFYSTQKKNEFSGTFSSSAAVTCLCASTHSFVSGSDLRCTVCGYTRDAGTPPVLVSKSTNQVVLEAIPGFEFSKDKVHWQTSPTFTGLSPNTEYTFYCRLAGGGTVSRGLTVRTAAAQGSGGGGSTPTPTPTPPSSVVSGDTNGDGQVTITDMIAIKAHILGKSKLSGASATAADTNGDGTISITDFIQVKAKILGKGI